MPLHGRAVLWETQLEIARMIGRKGSDVDKPSEEKLRELQWMIRHSISLLYPNPFYIPPSMFDNMEGWGLDLTGCEKVKPLPKSSNTTDTKSVFIKW